MPLVFALSAVTVTLTTAMALLPSVLRETPIEAPSVPLVDQQAERWYVVRSTSGSWYLNGEPMASQLQARILMGEDLPPGGISFLPSSARSAALVAADLAWLQNNSAGPVRLQLEEIQL